MVKRFFATVRNRIILLVFLAMIPSLVLAVYEYRLNRARTERDTEGMVVRLMNSQTREERKSIEQTRQILAALAVLPTIGDSDSADCDDIFSALLPKYPLYSNFGLVKADGEIICSAIPTDKSVHLTAVFIQNALLTRDFSIGDYSRSQLNVIPSLDFGYPVVDKGGQVSSVVFASLNLQSLGELAAESTLPINSTMIMIDRQGTILMRDPDPSPWLGKSIAQTELGQEMLLRRQGVSEVSGEDGISRVYAYRPLSGLPENTLSMAVGVSNQQVYVEIEAVRNRNLVVLTLVTILSVIVTWEFSRRFISRPIEHLVHVTRLIEAHDLTARSGIPPGDGELSQLANALDQMAASLEGHEAEHLRFEKQIQFQLNRLRSLRSIDVAISGSTDMRVILNTLLLQVTNELQVDAADILIYDPGTLMLEYNIGRGFRNGVAEQAKLHMGQGQVSEAFLEGKIIDLLGRNIPNEIKRNSMMAEEGFVAGYSVPLIAKGQLKGVLDVYHRSSLNPEQEWFEFFDTLAGQAAIAIENATLFEGLRRTNLNLSLAYDSTLEGWSRALDLRDKETQGHTDRVTEMTVRLARRMGFEENELSNIRRGALLHDIGKMGIPDAILLKPGTLTDAEWKIMRQHPVYAFELLSPIAYLRSSLAIPYNHHEKWDGSGYPRGLTKEQIPLAARIFAVIDVWDALRSERPYRAAWSTEKVIEHIRSLAGTHFDPSVVEAFLEMVHENSSLASSTDKQSFIPSKQLA